MTHAACYQAFGRDFYVEPASAQHCNAVFQDEYKIRDLRQHNVRTVLDVGAHVGSFTVLCHEFWPEARIVAVEPHPESFALLERNTAHIPESQLLRINAAITNQPGKCLLASSVSHSRVGEYVVELWKDLDPRYGDFGVSVPAMTTEELWGAITAFAIGEIDLLKLDCEGAEYTIMESLSANGHLSHVGWIRGEWHGRRHKHRLAQALAATHVYHVDPNPPHQCGLFIAHRKC
ncbi:MAG TPA: FkbM family methyltransferase [Lacipirellulaceae bacterium]|nr:FkbM family methyltransferase [Lacipirellulaceae bacterium]